MLTAPMLTARILNYDGRRLTLEPDRPIDRELLRQQCGRVELRLMDERTITADQRKKIFGIIRDISDWCGHDPEEIRRILTWEFRSESGTDAFSLSNVDRTTARAFLDWLIGFCFYHSVPTRDTLRDRADDVNAYLYRCLEYRKCAVCNRPADIHHVDRVGMGRDREEILHIGMKAIALCRKHHSEAHQHERAFFEQHHIHGIPLDRYLCDRLGLNTKEQNNGK